MSVTTYATSLISALFLEALVIYILWDIGKYANDLMYTQDELVSGLSEAMKSLFYLLALCLVTVSNPR